MTNNYFKILLTIFLVSIFLKCENKHQVVPNVYVNFYLSIFDPEFSDLAAPGNSIYVTGGVNGILIYRISDVEFTAFDRTCTFNVEENCQITTDESLVFASDTVCCGSKFLLLDGSVNEGPALYPLKRYETSFDGTYLHVYN